VRRGQSIAGIVAGAALAGCVTIPVPVDADLPAAQALRADVTLSELTEARRLYVGKCSGCHSLYAPTAFDDDAWRSHVRQMRPKARIDQATAERIWLYLASLNDRPTPDAAR